MGLCYYFVEWPKVVNKIIELLNCELVFIQSYFRRIGSRVPYDLPEYYNTFMIHQPLKYRSQMNIKVRETNNGYTKIIWNYAKDRTLKELLRN